MAERKTITCRYCGAEVQSVPRCSNCGKRIRNRPAGRFLKLLFVMTVFAGAVFVHRHFNHRDPRLIQIDDIKPYMNFRRVCIEGELLKPARQLKSGVVFYLLYDGTGRLAVFAPPEVDGKLYWTGNRIRAKGTLRTGVGPNRSLQATEIDWLGVDAQDALLPNVMLSDIGADKEGDTITVYGEVSQIRNPPPGSKAPYTIVLQDPSGPLQVVHWLDDPPELKAGDPVEVTGVVQVYRERIELRVYDAAAIQLQAEPEEPPVRLSVGEIQPFMEKKTVIVEGRLGPPRSIPGGVIYPLADGSGSIPVLFWDKKVSGEERDALDEDVRIRVEAPVVLYKGVLELVPEDVGAFQLLD